MIITFLCSRLFSPLYILLLLSGISYHIGGRHWRAHYIDYMGTSATIYTYIIYNRRICLPTCIDSYFLSLCWVTALTYGSCMNRWNNMYSIYYACFLYTVVSTALTMYTGLFWRMRHCLRATAMPPPYAAACSHIPAATSRYLLLPPAPYIPAGTVSAMFSYIYTIYTYIHGIYRSTIYNKYKM